MRLLVVVVLLASAWRVPQATAASANDGTAPGSDSLFQPKHLVVLMLENRAFDHMLGNLPGVDGITPGMTYPIDPQDPSAGSVAVSDTAPYVSPYDPCHALGCMTESIFGTATPAVNATPAMNGFVAVAKSFGQSPLDNVVTGFPTNRVPIISTLAQEFAVFDKWWCSVAGPTNPNRRFLHAATAQGSLDDADYDQNGFNSTTVFDRLTAHGQSWRVYYSDWSPLCMYQQLRTDAARANFKALDTFEEDARIGNLPAYSFLEPKMFPNATTPANDQHPDHSVLEGERLIKSVYEAMRASPLWEDSVLIITYDENGGYADHVPTPMHVPNPDGLNATGFNFTRLGPRVPTIVVSPFVEKGTIVGEAPASAKPDSTSRFEHSSVPATMRRIFGWSSGFLTKRDAWAPTFDFVWQQRTSPRTDCPETLPSVPPADMGAHLQQELRRPLNDLQQELLRFSNTCSPSDSAHVEAPNLENQGEGGEWIRTRFQEFLSQ